MFKVVKRDGEVASFDIGKITNAIEKAFKATDKQFNTDIIELLGLRVTADFQNKIKDSLIDVESIQDSVETVLEQSGYSDVPLQSLHHRFQTASSSPSPHPSCLRSDHLRNRSPWSSLSHASLPLSHSY